MALKDVVKVSRKTFFNPRAWVGYDQVKTSTLTFGHDSRVIYCR